MVSTKMATSVVHLSPTYFSPDSFVGGGERYAEELSRAMSARANVRFVSFGPREIRERVSPTFERVILKSRTRDKMTPFSERLLGALRGADIIHCYQYYVLPTFIAALFGRLTGKRVFVSDLGGGGWTPAYQIDQSKWIAAHLPISRYAARSLPGKNKKHAVIYGGIDLAGYPMRKKCSHDGSVVFLGRILPHKGIHFLIDGLPTGMLLKVIGPIGERSYYENLCTQSNGKLVTFLSGLSDEEVRRHLQTAMALVHPTPVNKKGDAGANELFGLAPVEAMASGCVPVLSNAASLPELIEAGESGMLVPPNNPVAIHDALLALKNNPGYWEKLSYGARRRVEAEFGWERVVDRCLEAYGSS